MDDQICAYLKNQNAEEVSGISSSQVINSVPYTIRISVSDSDMNSDLGGVKNTPKEKYQGLAFCLQRGFADIEGAVG